MIDNYSTSIEGFGMSDREAVGEIMESIPTMLGENAAGLLRHFVATEGTAYRRYVLSVVRKPSFRLKRKFRLVPFRD